MSALTVVSVDKGNYTFFKEECINTLILQDSEFSSAVVGKIDPGIEQAPHYHERPEGGEELIFVYQGEFELITKKEKTKFNTDQDGPVFIRVPSLVQASLRNTGKSVLKFFSVFAPTFKPGELKYLDS